jgi:DUF4097 and DUF4098 domain-containing protein YvlB
VDGTLGDEASGERETPDETRPANEGAGRPLRERTRTGLRVLAIVVALILIVVGASQLATSIFESKRTTVERFGEAVERLVIDADNGEITVTAAGSEIVVERDERYVFRRPDREAELAGSTLVLDDGCPSFNFLFLGGCRVDFRVTVPADIALELDGSNGDITVEGVAGGVVLRTSNGDIDLDRLSGDVDAETSNGSIVGRFLSSPSFSADTSNGRITLRFEQPPDRVVADSSNGDIDVEVPDLVYRIDADTDNGDIDVEVVSDPDAARTIEVRSNNGDIEVRRIRE